MRQDLLIGASATMERVRRSITQVARADLPVLVCGPTGAGKEIVARAIHAESGRRGELVAVNVCALAESMFEDALFGHVRGAFTGAVNSMSGHISEAAGGSLFLDEIGSLGTHLQAKLLRVLETKRFRRIGDQRDSTADFRLISATNEHLGQRVASDKFRADLAFRLCGVVIEVPSLSQRLEDIPHLTEYFVRIASSHETRTPDVATDAIDALRAHWWPGNIRELRYVIERALLMRVGVSLTGRDIREALRSGMLHEGTCAAPRQSTERQVLLDLLEEVNWDTVHAASRLGVSRVTVYRRLREHGITPDGRHARRFRRAALDTAAEFKRQSDMPQANSNAPK